MLKEGGRTGAFKTTQSSLASVAGVRGKGSSAGRVVDAQMVLVPVASMLVQPCCLDGALVSAGLQRGRLLGRGHTGIGPMK